jgi:hypothetical protein
MIERRIYSLLLSAIAVASVAGCATGKAQIADQPPALVVPPVPPREIELPVIVEAPPVEPLPEVAPPPTTTIKPTNRANRTTKPEPESKPEPVENAPTANTPPPVAPLRTPTTPSGPDVARQIREALDRAKAVLNRVDFQRLSDDRKANYKAAQGFIDQGLEALKKDDLTLARSFAERAELIARQLEPGR